MALRESVAAGRKVDFFIVGAAKAGTTSVFRYLSQHPQLFMPDDKEPHFFGDQRPFAKYGLYPRYEDYMALFEGADSGPVAFNYTARNIDIIFSHDAWRGGGCLQTLVRPFINREFGFSLSALLAYALYS